MATPQTPNPYEAPQSETQSTPNFRDGDPDVVELRRRVEELEKRLLKNWLVSPNRILRGLGVLGYFLIGYALLAVLIYSILGIVMLVWWLLGLANPLP